MSEESLAAANRLLSTRCYNMEGELAVLYKAERDLTERAEKAESELESANGEAAYWSGRAKSAENDRDAFKKAMLRRAGELADQDFRIQKAEQERDEAEERASQHWEAAKTYYRMYDAAMEEVSDLQVELWELKRALRTLGGDR